MSASVTHPLALKYPPSAAYQRIFMKALMSKLEDSGKEIIDSIYEEYSNVLMKGSEDSVCYKSYLMQNQGAITLKESTKLVSQGTTGLNTWPAAMHLVEWVSENRDIFNGKTLLEIGCGLGFTGLALIKTCQLQQYTFTDCHNEVLKNLHDNVYLNCSSSTTSVSSINSLTLNSHKESGDNTNTCGERITTSLIVATNSVASQADAQAATDDGDNNLRLPTIRIEMLDWEETDEDLLHGISSRTDYILATDVVYDVSIIPCLVKVLKELLYADTCRCAYVASTIRNESTRMKFLETLDKEQLVHKSLPSPQCKLFSYDRSVPIEILQISRQIL